MNIRSLSLFTLAFVLLTVVLTLVHVSLYSQGTVPLYGQCGGEEWTGSSTCVAGSCCTMINQYYAQCLPCPDPQLPPGCSNCPAKQGEICQRCNGQVFANYCCRGLQSLYRCTGEVSC